jgi:excinuclease ABC subunit A
MDAHDTISVRGAHDHNLKWVDVDIPHRTLTVVTGVSGSGKSSLAFDTIAAEGRRRYLETFSSYARQFLGKLSRPAVRTIAGLSPTVAVEQSTVVGNPRSTVGTMTELYDLLRLCWARLGSAPEGSGGPAIERRLFSFNSPHGACPACKGLGVEDRLDPDLLVSDPSRTVRGGALRITTPTGYLIYSQVTIDVLDRVCRAHGFSVDLRWDALTPGQREVILNGSDRIRIPYGKHPLESRMRWTGITAKPREEGVYKGILPVMEQILRQKRNRNILRFVRSMPCRACGGARLRPEALAVTFRGQTIAEVAALPIDSLHAFFDSSGVRLDSGSEGVLPLIRREVIERCEVLQHLGLGYLTLDRESATLSSGEA